MKRLALALVFCLAALGLHADETCLEDVQTLGILYQLRDMVLSPSSSSWSVSNRIDETVDQLREPLPEGGYRWVHLVRPDAGGPFDKNGHLVQAVHEAGDLDSFESSGDGVYAVRVVVPRKRSLFTANRKVWVGTVSIRIRHDGEETTRTETIGTWMSPDTSKTFDLGVIADRVDVDANVATQAATRGQALVEVHLMKAVPRDDPAGPHYATIQTLERLRGDIDPVNLDLEIGRLEQRLYPESQPIPVTLLVTRLRRYDHLMRSDKPEDQAKAKRLWEEIMRSIPR